MSRRWTMIGIAVGSLLFLFLGTILPRTTTEVFASPDETAVAAFTREGVWGWSGGFRLPGGINPMSPLVTLTGLHPRSMVQQGMMLVPVGFLGMPLMLIPFEFIRGFSSYVTVLLVLSSAFALFQLVRSFDRKAAWTSVMVYLSFPVVLLYTNRGLFPNLPVVGFGLWAMYLLRERKERWAMILAGLAIGFALTIRPVEALWLLPWIVWAGWKRVARRDVVIVLISALMICAIGYLMAVRTYGTWMPTIGYWLHDQAEVIREPYAVTLPNGTSYDGMSVMGEQAQPSVTILPFGIHPRAMWSNIQSFLFGIMGPWITAALVGLSVWMWRHRKNLTRCGSIALTAWTAFVLLLFYGQARYTDNINVAATLGNSFLRYLLPLVPLIAVGIGLLVEELSRHELRWKVLGIGIVTFFVVFGVTQALVRDEESIIPTRVQLQRYVAIRADAQRLFPPGVMIVSERSDKIFAGATNMISVSPLPDVSTVKMIEQASQPIALFHRVLTSDQQQTFNGGAFADWQIVDTFDNEALYVPPQRNKPF